MNKTGPDISVVVPVHNCSETVGKCLDSLVRIDHPSYEVIVVDDGSTDATGRICGSYGQIGLISLSKGGPSRARNAGIAKARGEFVAFTDGDCIVDDQWLKELGNGFVDSSVAGVGGDQISPPDDTGMGKLVHEFLKTVGFVSDYVRKDWCLERTRHNPSCNSMYRKEVLLEAGGFEEELWPGEDVELDLKVTRLGYTLMYNPAAKVAHYRPDGYARFARMFKRYGAAQGYLVKRYGMFRFIHGIPLVAVIGLALIAGLSVWYPWILLAPLAAVPLSWSWFLIHTRSIGKSVRFTVMLAILLLCWNVGFVSAYVSGRAPGAV